MKMYINTLILDTELLEFFEWDEEVKNECINFILALLQDKKMDSFDKLITTINLTYGKDISSIVARYICIQEVKNEDI
jgi:hypothetical protein